MNNPNMQIAPLSKRIISFIIDYVIVMLFILFIFSDQLSTIAQSVSTPKGSFAYEQEMREATAIFLSQNFISILVLMITYQALLIGYNGMTIGKYFTKTKVVSLDGSKISYKDSVIRAIIRASNEMMFYAGFLFALFTSKRQTIHGLLSKSVVVNIETS